jgi:uncharacterized membrane protein
MSRFVNFIKTTAIGGLLVIVPTTIILFVLAQILYGLNSVGQKLIAELGMQIDDALIMIGIAAASLIGLCFLTGLIVRTRIGFSLRNWLSRNVAKRIPMYNAISSLTQRFAGLDGNQFAPVEVDLYGSGARAIGFLIEPLPNDRCTVFIPSAPVATVGNIYVVSASRISKLDASVADTLAAVSQWGVDSTALYPSEIDGETASD